MLDLLIALTFCIASMLQSRRGSAHKHGHPRVKAVQSIESGKVISMPHVGGLHHQGERRAACQESRSAQQIAVDEASTLATPAETSLTLRDLAPGSPLGWAAP